MRNAHALAMSNIGITYSIMAGRIIGGTGILNGTPGVGAINKRAVCKMIALQWPTSWLGALGGCYFKQKIVIIQIKMDIKYSNANKVI